MFVKSEITQYFDRLDTSGIYTTCKPNINVRNINKKFFREM